MNEKWQITKKELLKKASPLIGGRLILSTEEAIVGTARALGYEVVDEPELPERLEYRAGKGFVDPRTGTTVAVGLSGKEREAAELILRYNTKAAVLEVAEKLRRMTIVGIPTTIHSDLFNLSNELRAAYETGNE